MSTSTQRGAPPRFSATSSSGSSRRAAARCAALCAARCSSGQAPLFELGARTVGSTPPSRSSVVSPAPALAPAAVAAPPAAALVAAGLLASAVGLKLALDKPSRPYEEGSVGREYDAWTQEGILEYYWGEHIHLGYYSEEEQSRGYKRKSFKQAKYDFIDQMLAFSGVQGAPARVLDVGCGIGGTSRYLARSFGPSSHVTGITLSPNQAARGTVLAAKAGLANCTFRVMDALAMDFPSNSFDFVWACESGEHMPDKKKYVEEMTRVLKPGGKIVIATWCQRETTAATPLTAKEQSDLRFLYEEWSHPYFVSIEEYERMLLGTSAYASVGVDDWARTTLPSWRHSIWVGVWDPWPVVARPNVWVKTVRDIVCLERMHRAFKRGLMTYGMIRGTKQAADE